MNDNAFLVELCSYITSFAIFWLQKKYDYCLLSLVYLLNFFFLLLKSELDCVGFFLLYFGQIGCHSFDLIIWIKFQVYLKKEKRNGIVHCFIIFFLGKKELELDLERKCLTCAFWIRSQELVLWKSKDKENVNQPNPDLDIMKTKWKKKVQRKKQRNLAHQGCETQRKSNKKPSSECLVKIQR